MLININTPINLNIDNLIDLSKLGKFMENNNLKINKSEIAEKISMSIDALLISTERFPKIKETE